MFAGKVDYTIGELLKDAPLGQAPSLLVKNTLGWKGLSGANTLDYFVEQQSKNTSVGSWLNHGHKASSRVAQLVELLTDVPKFEGVKSGRSWYPEKIVKR